MTTGFVQERDFTARQYHGRRENQEDYFAFADAAEQDETSLQRLLLVVGDGLGAHAGGSVASYIGVNTFVRSYHEHGGTRRARLRAALDTANETLGFITSRMPQVSSPMGTTLLAALIDQQELRWVSVGDSPLFLFRDGELRRLNADHSLAPLLEERVRAGFMTEEEAAQHPDRHALQSALLGEPMELVDDPEETLSLRSGDIIVAASDGLLTLSHKALEELLGFGRNTTADKIAEAVLFAIRRINYERQDNVTIGIVKVA